MGILKLVFGFHICVYVFLLGNSREFIYLVILFRTQSYCNLKAESSYASTSIWILMEVGKIERSRSENEYRWDFKQTQAKWLLFHGIGPCMGM